MFASRLSVIIYSSGVLCMMSSRAGPLETSVMGHPICRSISLTYSCASIGRSSNLRIPVMSHFQPFSFFQTGLALYS